jgi:hypothetical protein
VSALVRRLAVVAATALAALGFGLAHAGSAQADTYVACGFGSVYPVAGNQTLSCLSLQAAVDAAKSTFGSDTIYLMPGSYCPVNLQGNFYSPINFVGVGLSGVDTSNGPVELTGPEAGISTITYNSTYCGSKPSAVVTINAFLNAGPPFTFENLTIDTGGAGGPGYGIYANGNSADVTLRDVIVQNAGTNGIYYQSGYSAFHDYSLEVDNSAILNNGTGVTIWGFGSIYDSTVAGNTLGVDPHGEVSLGSDTITRNGYGVNASCCGNRLQVVDTINADNVHGGCQASADWENLLSSWNNLLSDTSCFGGNSTTDIHDSSVTLDAPNENGGPTPSIPPPTAAQGHGSGCGLYGVDQREYLIGGGACDIGSVQQSANGVASTSASDVALGYVDTGVATNASVYVSNAGGDIVGVSKVSIAGVGWSVVGDGCTHAVLAHGPALTSCVIGLSVTPPADGPWNATLTIYTTAGTKHVTLTSQAVTRATGQDDEYDVPDASLVVPAPGLLANDAIGTTYDEVVTPPSNGTLTGPNADGSFTYTPNDGYIGDDSFQYTVIANGLFESHPITVTLHVLGFTVATDAPTYALAPGASFTIHATVTPLRGYTGDVCLDVADASGATWPNGLSPDAFTYCSATDGDTGADVSLDGTNPVTVDLNVNVDAGVAPNAYSLELLGSTYPAPSMAAPFVLDLQSTDPTAVSGFHPSSGGAGTTVTILGSSFTGATAVSFNGTPAQSFTVVSDSRIDAVVAAGTTSGPISVTAPLGTATSSASFSFFAPPTITSVSPTTAGVRATVTVTGTHLNGATGVTLNGTSAPFAVISATTLTFTVPAGATSGTVSVTTPGGSATSADTVIVSPPPTITSLSTNTGPVGTTVTIAGTNLAGTVGVMLGSIVTVPTSVSDGSVTFTIPPGAPSGTIEVITTSGSATSIDTFTVTG